MPMATETHERRDLVVSREPVGPVKKTDQKTDGENILRDALILVLIAWGLYFAIMFSLRGHIV